MVDCVAKFQCILVNLFYVFDKQGIQIFKVVCDYICSVLDRAVRGSKYFSGSQSFPSYQVAIRLNYSSDTIRRLNFNK